MAKKISGNSKRIQRKKRVRAKIAGNSERPRLAVFKSLTSVYAQVFDDTQGKTLVAARLAEIKGAKNTIEGAGKTGELLAKKCKEAGISAVVFDRGGYQYHGKVKALADGARKGGLKF